MTGSYLVVKLKGRILIQLEHHFLHLHVDILFVTYKTDSINHYNFYRPIKFNWPTDFFGIRHGLDCCGTFENIYICIWISSFQEIFLSEDHNKIRNIFDILCYVSMSIELFTLIRCILPMMTIYWKLVYMVYRQRFYVVSVFNTNQAFEVKKGHGRDSLRSYEPFFNPERLEHDCSEDKGSMFFHSW